MSLIAVSAYVFSVIALFAKFLVTISLQGKHRTRSGRFRHAEDAAHWGGEVATMEAPLVRRLQASLDNDGESRGLSLALGGAYVALGITPWAAPLYFGTFVAARVAHGIFMVRARQPHRTRAFTVGMMVLLAMSVHIAITSARMALG